MRPQRFPLQLSQDTDTVPSTGPPHTRQKQTPIAPIAVQSFAAFRAQTSSVPGTPSIRRKPLPLEASPVATRYSSAEDLTKLHNGESKPHFPQRSFSIDSPPLLSSYRPVVALPPPVNGAAMDFMPRDLDRLVSACILHVPAHC